jgi:hypothetical protein
MKAQEHSVCMMKNLNRRGTMAHKLGRLIPVGAIFTAAVKTGRARGRKHAPPPAGFEALRVLP